VNTAQQYESSFCKPSIVEVVEDFIHLRRAGKEHTGLCPFHAEKTASFFVNEDKGLFYCHGCHVGGDVIKFIELIENVSFKEACAILKLETYKPKPRPHRAQAEKIVTWARAMSQRLGAALRDIGGEIYICSIARKQADADKELTSRVEAELVRQWAILSDLDDDLNDPKLVLELWQQRENIERLVELAELA
jgi:DNA primase